MPALRPPRHPLDAPAAAPALSAAGHPAPRATASDGRQGPLVRGLLAAGLLLWGAAVQAQSLNDLYQAARAYDATYLAAKALAESAPFRAEQARALNRPSAAVTGSVTTSQIDPPRGSNLSSTSTNLALQGRQSLFNRSNKATISQAERQLELSRFDLETAEQDLIIRVSQAYFDVLAAQDALATIQASKKATSEQLASAKRNFEVGTSTITDTREAQARFDLVVAQEIAAENDLRSKRVVLDQLVGRTDVAPKQLIVPASLPPLMPADIAAWVSRAEAEHPAIKRAQLGLDIARLETEKAKAGGSVTVDAVASLNNANASGSAANLSGNKGNTNTASLGLQLSWPLYTGGAVQNRVKETLSLEEQSRQNLDAARRSVTQATRTAYLGVQSGLAQVKALEAAESSNLLAVEATLLGYRVGVRVNLDVLNAQTQLFTTRRDLAQARYNVLLAGLRLRQASGKLAPEDIAAIDTLLKK